MPELNITRPDGKLVEEAFPIVISAMHLPRTDQQEARKQLCDYMRAGNFIKSLEPDDRDEISCVVSDKQIRMLRRGRPLNELVPDVFRHYRDGFVASHWLVFRLFGAMHRPQLNSNARWYDYASAYLMRSLPNGRDWNWTANPKTLKSTIRKYGSVAHLWAAVTYTESYSRTLLRDPNSIDFNRALAWATIAPGARWGFYQRAQGFYQAAVTAGVYDTDREDALVPLEAVWKLPGSIEADPPAIDHPDRLISVDFDEVDKHYKPKHMVNIEERAKQRTNVKPKLSACL